MAKTEYVDLTEHVDLDETTSPYLRGLAKQNRGDLEGAIADFSEAIRTDPFAAFLYRARALTLKEIGQCEAANADARRAGLIRLDEETNVAERFDCAPETEQDGQD